MKLDERLSRVGELIDQSVASVFETMAFMQVRRIQEACCPDGNPVYWGKVDLLEPLQGSIVLACSGPLLEEIAETLFVELPEGTEVCLDVIAEITNTVAGNLLAALAGQDELVKVGLPETGEGPCKQAINRLIYQVDDGRCLCVCYQLDSST